MQGAYGLRIAAAVRRRDWLEDKPLDVDTPTREQQLTNALRDALNLAARALDEADEYGNPEAPPTHDHRKFVEEATAEIARLMKVLDEK